MKKKKTLTNSGWGLVTSVDIIFGLIKSSMSCLLIKKFSYVADFDGDTVCLACVSATR